MAAALMWRGPADGWAVAGTAIGGLAVGALGSLLGREGEGLLSGVSTANVTDPFEGVVLGTAAGFAAWTSLSGCTRRTVIAVCVLAGFGAAALIHFSGGTLLAGSLQALEQGLAGTQLSLAQIGMVIGEPGLTGTATGLTVGAESQIFILSIGASLIAVRDRPMKPA